MNTGDIIRIETGMHNATIGWCFLGTEDVMGCQLKSHQTMLHNLRQVFFGRTCRWNLLTHPPPRISKRYIYIAVLTVSSTENHVGDTVTVTCHILVGHSLTSSIANVRWGCLKIGLTPHWIFLNGEWWECVIMIQWICVKICLSFFRETHPDTLVSVGFLTRFLRGLLGFKQGPFRIWCSLGGSSLQGADGIIQHSEGALLLDFSSDPSFLLRKYPKLSVHVRCLYLFVHTLYHTLYKNLRGKV